LTYSFLDLVENNHQNLFFYMICIMTEEINQKTNQMRLIWNELSKILGIEPQKLKESFLRGNLKRYQKYGINAVQFRKGIGKIEFGTVVTLGDRIEVVRGFPKIRRTLVLHPSLEHHFVEDVAVEEKMNGYNVRIAILDGNIIAFTRRGYICPYTTKKVSEILDLDEFFLDYPQIVICGEMVGTENPYVSHYYPEIGKLGFRIFDLREKLTNLPIPVLEKIELLNDYGLSPVHLFGIYSIEEASGKIMDIVKDLGKNDREGVVIKDPQMKLEPLKYTSSQAQASELEYAFSFPFDLGKAFFFSRIIREGFQAYELAESKDELKERANRIGESILYPMLKTIQHVSQNEAAAEDLVIQVESQDEAEEFIRHLRDLGVFATLVQFEDGKAVIRRLHQSTTDKIINYLNGGLY
jgi:DNA/RNA ligase